MADRTRRHHNNKGTRQIKRGKTYDQVKRIARKLRIPFAVGSDKHRADVPVERDG